MRKIKRCLCLLLLLCIISAASCAELFDEQVLIDAGINVEEVHVHIPGLTKTYHFLWVSDLHIVIDNDEIADDKHDLVQSRQTSWAIRSDGKQAGDYWTEELAEVISSSNPDAIFFGGDMLDLCTEATINKLKEGLDKITPPWMYIRADHDEGIHWLKDTDREKNQSMQEEVCDNSSIFTLSYPEFTILGINISTSQMLDDAVDKAKEVVRQGKPIIVVTHVPYDSIVDRSLDGISRAAWQDRNLCWGSDTSYVPGEKMQEWMDVVLSEGSPVVEILAGHLHLTWDGMVTERVHEHVFSQAFSGNVGLITVDGE